MAYVKMVRATDQVEIWVNTDQVRMIQPAFSRQGVDPQQTILVFDDVLRVSVAHGLDEVAVWLSQ